MRLLSEAGEYGLRAVVWMAQRPPQPQKVKVIAEQIKAAPGYLIKVLQELAKHGILSARRGSQGGYLLEQNPAELTVLDVLSAIDPIERIPSCPLATAAHGTGLCPVHRHVDAAIALLESHFQDLTIQDLVEQYPVDGHWCEHLATPRCPTKAPSRGAHHLPAVPALN